MELNSQLYLHSSGRKTASYIFCVSLFIFINVVLLNGTVSGISLNSHKYIKQSKPADNIHIFLCLGAKDLLENGCKGDRLGFVYDG